MCFGVTIIWFFHYKVIEWPLNSTSCGYIKFMKVICAFDELANFVHVEMPLQFKLIQFYLVNSKSLPEI